MHPDEMRVGILYQVRNGGLFVVKSDKGVHLAGRPDKAIYLDPTDSVDQAVEKRQIPAHLMKYGVHYELFRIPEAPVVTLVKTLDREVLVRAYDPNPHLGIIGIGWDMVVRELSILKSAVDLPVEDAPEQAQRSEDAGATA